MVAQNILTQCPAGTGSLPAAVKSSNDIAENTAVKPGADSFAGQRKLSVQSTDELLEHEAEVVADTVMRMPGQPFVQRKCTNCQEEDKIQKKPLTATITAFIQTKATVNKSTASDTVTNQINATKGNGSNMDRPTQSFMESRFGTGFSGVKIHTGDYAVQMSRELNAQAFTVGSDIYFNNGKYNPSSDGGKHLLAHELTHVVQQGGGIPGKEQPAPFGFAMRKATEMIYRKDGPKKSAACTSVKILLPNALVLYGTEGPLVIPIETNIAPQEGTITFSNISHNFILPLADKGKVFFNYSVGPKDVDLFNKYTQSITSANVPLTIKASPDAEKLTPGNNSNLVPRPGALPIDGDYKLIPVNDAPSPWVDSLPEDKIVKVIPPKAGVLSTNPFSPYTLNPFAGVGMGLNTGVNSTLSTFGFAPVPGGNGIGLIGFPRAFSSPSAIPQSFSTWGHTEVYIRVNGKVVAIRGYTVESILEAIKKADSVTAGKTSIPAKISSSSDMFYNTASKTIEYPVSEETARLLLEKLPAEGKPSQLGPVEYTGRPAVLGKGSNCVTWACAQAEEALGGKVGTNKLGPITEPVDPAQGLQGRFMKAAGSDTSEMLAVENATGEAVISSMPKSLQVLKWGGRVFIVIGAGLTIYEIVNAPEEQKTRTAIGATSGFLGGLAAGAAAGLLCGPGAIACSLILGLALGIAGAFTARAAAEGIYDDITNPGDTKIGPRKNVSPDGTWIDDKGAFHMGPGPKW